MIKFVHTTELRGAIDVLRAVNSLSPFIWSDPMLTAGTSIVRAQHIVDLRMALSQVYAALSLPPPTYTDPVLTTIKAAHIEELRAAIIAIE